MLRRIFIMVPALMLMCGFTCSPGVQKKSEVKSASPTSTSAQASGSAPGTLRFRITLGTGVALVERMDRDSATIRIWDWEHEPSPQSSKEVKLEEFLNAENSVGQYMHEPEMYVELSGVTCSPEQDVDFVCSQLVLKTNAEFNEKVHKDPEFRERLGRMIGSPITANRANAVFNISDVK